MAMLVVLLADREMESLGTNSIRRFVAADAKEVRSPGLLDSHRAGTKASARQGLPEPRTIFKGATRITAPVGGTSARFASWVSPYFPAPSM